MDRTCRDSRIVRIEYHTVLTVDFQHPVSLDYVVIIILVSVS